MYWSSAFKIAEARKKFRDSGKRVIAYAEQYGNASYLISSQANEVLINEYGQVSAPLVFQEKENTTKIYIKT